MKVVQGAVMFAVLSVLVATAFAYPMGPPDNVRAQQSEARNNEAVIEYIRALLQQSNENDAEEHSASKQGPQCRCEESLGGPSEKKGQVQQFPLAGRMAGPVMDTLQQLVQAQQESDVRKGLQKLLAQSGRPGSGGGGSFGGGK